MAPVSCLRVHLRVRLRVHLRVHLRLHLHLRVPLRAHLRVPLRAVSQSAVCRRRRGFSVQFGHEATPWLSSKFRRRSPGAGWQQGRQGLQVSGGGGSAARVPAAGGLGAHRQGGRAVARPGGPARRRFKAGFTFIVIVLCSALCTVHCSTGERAIRCAAAQGRTRHQMPSLLTLRFFVLGATKVDFALLRIFCRPVT